MAIGAPWVGTVVEGNVAGTNGTSVTVDVSGATNGEVVWIIGTIGDSELGTVLPPSGWNLYTENSEGTSGGSSSRTIVFWKVKASGDGSTTISDAGNWTVSVKRQFVPISWPGVDTTTPAEGLTNVAHTTGTSYATGTDTPTSNDRWAVGVFSSRGSTALVTWTADAALTSRASVINSSSIFIGLLVADSNGAVTQASHSYTSTGQSASHGLGLLMFLIPASVAAAPASPSGLSTPTIVGMFGQLLTPMVLARNVAHNWASVAGPVNTPVALNASLSFTGSQNNGIAKGVTAALSFTSSQTRAIATNLIVAALSFTGSLGTAAVHHFTQALNATLSFTSSQTRAVRTNLAAGLSFTGSQTRAVRKNISAALSFTSSQARAVRTNLAGALSFTSSQTRRTAKNLGAAALSFTGSIASQAVHHFTQALNATLSFNGSVATAAVHFFTQALNASLSFTSSQTRSIGTHLAGAVSFTGSVTKRTGKSLGTAVLSFTSSQARAVRTSLAATLSFTGSVTKRTAKSLGTATLSFTGSLATQAVHFFTQALNATLSFTGSLSTHRTITRVFNATLSFTSSQTKRTATTLLAGLSFTGSQTKRIAKTISAALGLTGLLTRLSSAQPTSGTASAAQMSVPESTPPSSTTAPTSEAGNASGPTSSAP